MRPGCLSFLRCPIRRQTHVGSMVIDIFSVSPKMSPVEKRQGQLRCEGSVAQAGRQTGLGLRFCLSPCFGTFLPPQPPWSPPSPPSTAGQTSGLSQGTLHLLPFAVALQEPTPWIYPNAAALKFWERQRRLCLASRSLPGLQSCLDSSQDKTRFPEFSSRTGGEASLPIPAECLCRASEPGSRAVPSSAPRKGKVHRLLPPQLKADAED